LNPVLVSRKIKKIGTTLIAELAQFFSRVFHFPKFERVSDCTTAREIWVRLQSYHERTAQVKTRLYETYKREYETFTQLDGESINAMFSRF
jgi:hypothetical protein